MAGKTSLRQQFTIDWTGHFDDISGEIVDHDWRKTRANFPQRTIRKMLPLRLISTLRAPLEKALLGAWDLDLNPSISASESDERGVSRLALFLLRCLSVLLARRRGGDCFAAALSGHKLGKMLHRADPDFLRDPLDFQRSGLPTFEPFRANGGFSMFSKTALRRLRQFACFGYFISPTLAPPTVPSLPIDDGYLIARTQNEHLMTGYQAPVRLLAATGNHSFPPV
ncbi:hypothetical protein EWE75_17045 [Sphingomonas populi]|uniref:Uncharacterized protein n=1 Tax=Sphingomonas populi TaxID=2484750 RepID=A0A4Q6XZF5_9SPHN|nr:hypothetical protein [Sphingomonas populi]RZF63252.1 hypothetical protein EWE75_17045 [Sphingomonas populi]